MSQELIFQLALSLIKGVGPITAKKLIAYCGGPEAVFKEKIANLKKIPTIGNVLAKEIQNPNVLSRAEQEMKYIQGHGISILSYWDSDYPTQLKQCIDAPILLFSKGKIDWSNRRIISVVGTRKASAYGLSVCKDLIKELSVFSPIIVSGLAYGIDSCAHKEALKNNLQTIGVLAHGLERIYPQSNENLAKQMTRNGGLLTEFLNSSKLLRENFVRRNRIVAGLADATIVIESKIKGGAMITAKMANSYSRDVFAVPARVNDKYSLGCLELIKNNEAMIYTSIEDIVNNLSWQQLQTNTQTSLFDFTPNEKSIYDLIAENKELHIDNISQKSELSASELAEILMKLELEGVINARPGSIYCI
ncbi:MAG: DNA-protecting protein DprA [Flavobacteriales bacterium]|nr:DNA-protecting protein DprA [Flavobacteriales bacterium]